MANGNISWYDVPTKWNVPFCVCPCVAAVPSWWNTWPAAYLSLEEPSLYLWSSPCCRPASVTPASCPEQHQTRLQTLKNRLVRANSGLSGCHAPYPVSQFTVYTPSQGVISFFRPRWTPTTCNLWDCQKSFSQMFFFHPSTDMRQCFPIFDQDLRQGWREQFFFFFLNYWFFFFSYFSSEETFEEGESKMSHRVLSILTEVA